MKKNMRTSFNTMEKVQQNIDETHWPHFFSPMILSRIRIHVFFPGNLSQGLVLDRTLTLSAMMMQHNIIDCGACEVRMFTCQLI